MNTRRNPNYPFSKRNYNKGSSMLFKPLERAARIADAEIKKSKKNSSINKVKTEEEKKFDRRGWIVFLVVIVFLVLFFAISIPTGFINSKGAIVVLIIGAVLSFIIGGTIPIEE